MKLIATYAYSMPPGGRFGLGFGLGFGLVLNLGLNNIPTPGLHAVQTAADGDAGDAGTAQADILQTKLAEFATDVTRAQQLGHLDGLVQSWGAISAIEKFAQSNPAFYAQITALEQLLGLSSRVIRHQYQCGAGRTQKSNQKNSTWA